MRAEYSFWKGLFVLAFLDELYPHTLQTGDSSHIPNDAPLMNIQNEILYKKCKLIKKTNLKDFFNLQITKHENGFYIRWLDEWEIEGYKNPNEYFKSPLVQEFFTKVDKKTFYKVLRHIIECKGRNPLGTPDYIIWNDKEMVFVEVKRKNETLKPEQIEWGEFLIKNKIPYKVLRVNPYSLQ